MRNITIQLLAIMAVISVQVARANDPNPSSRCDEWASGGRTPERYRYAPTRETLVVSQSVYDAQAGLNRWALGFNLIGEIFGIPVQGFDRVYVTTDGKHLAGELAGVTTILGTIADRQEEASGDLAFPVFAKRVTLGPNIDARFVEVPIEPSGESDWQVILTLKTP